MLLAPVNSLTTGEFPIDFGPGPKPKKQTKPKRVTVPNQTPTLTASDMMKELGLKPGDFDRLCKQANVKKKGANSRISSEEADRLRERNQRNIDWRENDDEWNTNLTGRLSLAQQIFNGENSEEDLAKAALWAAAAPKYRELLYSQVEVNKRLQAELAKYRGSEPGVSSKATAGGSRASNANGSKSEDFVTNVLKSLGR